MAFPCTTPTPPLPGAQAPLVLPPPPQQLPIDIGTFVAVPPDPVVPPPPPPPPAVAPRFVSEFRLTSKWVLYWLATLCRATYSVDGTLFTRAARAVVPMEYPITFIPNAAGLVPGYGIIKMPEGAVVCVSGTTNLPQWLDQVLNSAPYIWGKTTPPGPTGGVSTLSIYAAAAQAIWASLIPIVPLDDQILFCGHSMGGAIATLLHGVAAADPNQRVPSRCVSFAAPKPGGILLASKTRITAQVYQRLIVDTDFVPSLPPNLNLINVLVPPPLRGVSDGWTSFQHAATPTVVEANGTVESGPDPLLLVQIIQAVAAAALGNPLAVTTDHLMTTFVGRLYQGVLQGTEATPTTWSNPNDLLQVNSLLTSLAL